MEKQFKILVIGNIGSGKTSLTTVLNEKLNDSMIVKESFENNQYL